MSANFVIRFFVLQIHDDTRDFCELKTNGYNYDKEGLAREEDSSRRG